MKFFIAITDNHWFEFLTARHGFETPTQPFIEWHNRNVYVA